jgi:hypothetical protein
MTLKSIKKYFSNFAPMKKLLFSILFVFVTISISVAQDVKVANDWVPPGGARLMVQVENGDTVFLCWLKDIWVFPKSTFKNKRQEQFFWKTVRDVKKTLPYAKVVGSELRRVNMLLVDMKNERERKKYLAIYEKQIFEKYEKDLKKMSVSQGKLLLKLIDRECSTTSYDLIKQYRGNVTAFFWQGVARLFGSNLKSEYDAKGNDKVLEKVILLVESGQL